jgi:hypothetical protein
MSVLGAHVTSTLKAGLGLGSRARIALVALGLLAVSLPVTSRAVADAPANNGCVPVPVTSTYFQDPNTQAVHAARRSNDATVTVFANDAPVRNAPLGWSPIRATNAELRFYGIPARPTATSPLAAWKQTWSRYSYAPPPTLCMDTEHKAPIYSYNWAADVDGGRSDYAQISAHYTEPTHTYCPGTSPSSHAMWVGIGGANGLNRLMQNGTSSEGTIDQDHFWFEVIADTHDTWLVKLDSSYAVNGTQPTVKKNDILDISTSYDPAAKTVRFSFRNSTTGYFKQVGPMTQVRDHNGVAFAVAGGYDGQSAEVVDEREENPTTKKYDQLRQFTQMHWTSATVYVASGAKAGIRDYSNTGEIMALHGSTDPANEMARVTGVGLPTNALNTTWERCGAVEAVPQ